jgi:uncharacterized protein (DUF433 family)
MMATATIHDRGRGPEIEGTRITVDNLLPHLLDEEATEASICRHYDLTPEQVAAARAYVLSHADVVLNRHMQIEARMAEGNPPEVVEQAERSRAALVESKEWLARRRSAEAQDRASERDRNGVGLAPEGLPTFKEWLAETVSRGGPDDLSSGSR